MNKDFSLLLVFQSMALCLNCSGPVGQKNMISSIQWRKADHLKTRNKKTEREEPRTERALQGLLFSALPTSSYKVPTTSQEPSQCKHISKSAPTVIADSGNKPVTQEPGRTIQIKIIMIVIQQRSPPPLNHCKGRTLENVMQTGTLNYFLVLQGFNKFVKYCKFKTRAVNICQRCCVCLVCMRPEP